MLEAFNPEVHRHLNSLGCDADTIKELVYWSFGANKLSSYHYESIFRCVKQMQKALSALDALDKRFNDVV